MRKLNSAAWMKTGSGNAECGIRTFLHDICCRAKCSQLTSHEARNSHFPLTSFSSQLSLQHFFTNLQGILTEAPEARSAPPPRDENQQYQRLRLKQPASSRPCCAGSHPIHCNESAASPMRLERHCPLRLEHTPPQFLTTPTIMTCEKPPFTCL